MAVSFEHIGLHTFVSVVNGTRFLRLFIDFMGSVFLSFTQMAAESNNKFSPSAAGADSKADASKLEQGSVRAFAVADARCVNPCKRALVTMHDTTEDRRCEGCSRWQNTDYYYCPDHPSEVLCGRCYDWLIDPTNKYVDAADTESESATASATASKVSPNAASNETVTCKKDSQKTVK